MSLILINNVKLTNKIEQRNLKCKTLRRPKTTLSLILINQLE